MKNTILIIGIAISALLAGCSEKELENYQGGLNSIYFNEIDSANIYRPVPKDTTTFTFSGRPVLDTVITLRVKTMGDVVNRDRNFSVEIDSDKTTAPNTLYELDQHLVIPAKSNYGYIRIRLFKKPELTPDTTFSLQLRLKANEEFELSLETHVVNKLNNQYVDLLNHTLLFSDRLEKPGYWDMSYERYFGIWGRRKHIIIETLIPDIDWSIKYGTYELVSMASFIADYLNKMKLAGTPEKEADGTEVKMGAIVG